MDANERLDRLLGELWHDDSPRAFLTRLTELDDRLGGHPGERRAADLVAEAFDEAGADPDPTSFELRRWERGRTDLAVSLADDASRDDRSFEAVALPYSPPADVRGELVDVGYGTPEELEACDLRGKVAVASTASPPGERRVHRLEKFGHAAAVGAVAFVFANHVPGQLPPTGSLGFEGEAAAIPGVGVSRETGAWLTDYAEAGRSARLRVEAATTPGRSQNVVGTLGPATDEEVLVVAHYDAHDVGEGALDNGCGVAILVTAARLLAEMDLERRVRLVGVGCEEVGLLGSRALAAELPADRLLAVVNVDGAGRFRNLRALTHAHPTLPDRVRRVVEGVGHPLTVDETPHPYSDHWPFLRRGVPALQLHSERPGESDSRWERGWTHTRADTREKVDGRTLRAHAMLTALVVRDLAGGDDPPRVEADDLRERLREAGAESGMRAAGVWPDDW